MKSTLFIAISLFAFWGCSNSNSAPNTSQSQSYVLGDETALQSPDTLAYIKMEKPEFQTEIKEIVTQKPAKIIPPFDPKGNVIMPDAVFSISDLYTELQKQPESFVFSAKKQKEIICAEGTKIYIPEKAFVYAGTDKIVTGEITLQVTEYYELKDILLTKLSTNTTENVLETGGMIYITVSSNGDSCVLADGKMLALEFNTNDPEKTMQTFSGISDSDDNIIWEMQKPLMDQSRVYTFYESIAEFPGGNTALSNYFSENLQYPKEAIISKIEGVVYISFVVSQIGIVKDVTVVKSLNTLCDAAAAETVAKMPQWKPGIKNGVFIDQKMTIPITFSLDDLDFAFGIKASKIKQDKTLKEDDGDWLNGAFYKEKPLILPNLMDERTVKNDSFDVNSNSREISNALIYAQNLGWINCDRFMKFDNPTLNYTVKIESGLDEEVSLIFDNYNAVLKGSRLYGRMQFNNVPKDEPITLFGIKNIEGNLFYFIKKTFISDQIEGNFEYNPASKEELMLVLNTAFAKKEI